MDNNNKELNHKIIKLWTIYGFNFVAPTFIEKAFEKAGPSMVQHLKGKFEECYNIAGTYGAFFYFWAELSTNYQMMLEEWVLDNFKG